MSSSHATKLFHSGVGLLCGSQQREPFRRWSTQRRCIRCRAVDSPGRSKGTALWPKSSFSARESAQPLLNGCPGLQPSTVFGSGSTFTRLTASYNLGDPGWTTWRNTSAAEFTQVLIPQFQAARPSTTATWVQASPADLKYNLKMTFSGTIPKAVKIDTLYWELARPLAAVFPGAADVQVSVNGSALNSSTSAASVRLSVTYSSYPPAGAPYTLDATGLIKQMQGLLANKNVSVSANAATFINNITSIQPQALWRVTNATLSYVVPSSSSYLPSGNQELYYTFIPIMNDLQKSGISNLPDNGFSPAPPTSPYDIYSSPSPAQTNMLANGTNVTQLNSTNTTAATNSSTNNSSGPPSGGASGAPASWEFLALVYEDVSSFFVGQQAPFVVSTMACAATRDTCCRNCDPTKSCVKKPLCVPKDLTLTIEEQICLAPSNVNCWQRSYGCGNYYQDLAPAADQMYQYYRGFWDFSWNQYWNKVWGQGNQYNFYYDPYNCVPWRFTGCFQAPTPEQCSGMCTVMDQAICGRDDCTTWDPVRQVAVTDPCCGGYSNAQCAKGPIPLNATATCVWDSPSQRCRLQKVDNCVSPSLSANDKVVCRISNIMTANGGRKAADVATDLCSSTVTNLCSVASSPACKYCELIQGKLATAISDASEEAKYCGAAGDPSPYYNSTGLKRNQGQLLKSALTLLLDSSVMCDAVADALLPASGTPLLSSSNLQSHGGAWICSQTAMADQICDSGGSAVVYTNSKSGSAGDSNIQSNSGNVTGSTGAAVNSTSDTGRDCSKCGSYLEEFATVAGTSTYTKASVSSFCMSKQMQQYQAELAAGRPDEFVTDVCVTEFNKYQWCNPEYGCAHTRQCVSSDPSVSVQNLACTPLSSNATTCNQKAECVFVPSGNDEFSQQCARVASSVRQNGVWQLTNPINVCRMWAGNLQGTCGNACQPGGYCNTTGAGDPQCVQACSRCNKCIAAVQYAAHALNVSASWTMYGGYSPDPVAAQTAYKACMSQALGRSNTADAGSNGTTSGQCMAPGSALCGVFQQVNNYCDQSSGCQMVESCRKFDTSTCDPTASTWTGVACKVNQACNRLLSAPQALPAATLCGPEYLNSCTVNNTSFECAKCLNDADDLQSRLRTSPRFKCRNLYDPIQIQQCLKYFIGWNIAKSNCPAVPKLFDKFEQVNNLNVTSYYTWTWYPDWYSQPYSDFCWNLQAANNNGGNPVGVSPGYPLSTSGSSPTPSPAPTPLAPPTATAKDTSESGDNTTILPTPSPKLPALAPSNGSANANTTTNSTGVNTTSLPGPPPPAARTNATGSSNASNATTLPNSGPSPTPPSANTNTSSSNVTGLNTTASIPTSPKTPPPPPTAGSRHLLQTASGGNMTAASLPAPTNASNANNSSPSAPSNHTMPPAPAPSNNTLEGNASYMNGTLHSNGTYVNGSSGGNDMYTAGTAGSDASFSDNTPGSNTPYTNGSMNHNGSGYATGFNDSQGGSDSGLANQSSTWPGPVPPCQPCVKSPAWVHDVLTANSSTVCVTRDSSQYCRLSQGMISCHQGYPAPDCSPVVQCFEDRLPSCLEPLQRPEVQMLPLLQLEPDEGLDASGSIPQFGYTHFLPSEAVKAAGMLVQADASNLGTPALPLGFGCPDFPPVMPVMQDLGFNQSTMPDFADLNSNGINSSVSMSSSSSNITGSSLDNRSNSTSNSTNSSTDLTSGSSNTSSSSSINMTQGVPRSATCWVDATVAMNLMVGSMLEALFSAVTPQADSQSVNVPYSSVNSWTVYWMPPNLRCPYPGAPGCLNRTFTFQLETWVPCGGSSAEYQPIAQKVVNLDSGTVDGTNGTDNGTVYCLSNLHSPLPMYNTATFAPNGPMGSTIRAPPCNTSITDNQTDAVMCQGPPMYPISADGLPEALFAEPLSSYDVANVQGTLQRTTSLQAGYSQLPWCPPAVEPCSMNYVPSGLNNGTNPGPDKGSYNQTGPGTYLPPPPPPMTEPGWYIYDNSPEGVFQPMYSYTASGNQITQYIYYSSPPPYQYDYIAEENKWFYTLGQSWTDTWQCNYVVRFVARAMKGGYISETPAGLYESCVDYATSRGSPAYMQMIWSGQNNCNSWGDSCCPDVGLKPGNKAVCEAQSSCSFSASCSLATVQRQNGTIVADDCYSQFWDSLYNVTSATYATCDPSCSFQPLGWTSNDATIRALPTARTAADGTTSLQQGICYNKTVWDTCTTKTTEATCHSWSSGNNICSWAPTCKPPTAADFNCLSSTDSCCLESSSAAFSQDQRTTCTAQTGANNRPCKVDKQCYLLIDPCTAKVTPWDCLADATCQFTPTHDARMGGACITQQASDPCAGLAASACSSTATCALADRCVTDRCLDPTDNCCALSGKDAACRADPTCMVTSVCLPVADECVMYDATTCQDSDHSFCQWQDFSSGPAPEYNSTLSNLTSHTNTSNNGASTGNISATNCNSSNPDACNTSTPTPTPGVCVMDESKHPCSQATDLQTCSSQIDSLGRRRCYSQGNCLSACSQCASCISQITSSFEPQLNSNDSVKVSQSFSTWCYSKNVAGGTCDTITAAIIHSPQGNLARRPGMLCTMAGQCPTGCNIPITDVNGTVIKREPLDMCTDNGTVSGRPVPVPVQAGSTCLADSDCTTNGAWCDLGVAATQVCRCVSGLDMCNIVGHCNSDQCPRLTSLTTVNRDLAGCSHDSDCTVGFVCQMTPYQTYNCSNSVVTPTNHSGYCVEAAPSLTTAKLDENAATITVSLSVAASGFTTSCSAIVSDNTAAKLGSGAICSVDPDHPDLKQMSILLQSAPAINWGTDKLECVGTRQCWSFAGNTTAAVAKCEQCPAPVAILAGPLLVTKPCPGSNAADFNPVFFDASRSVGTAAAPVANVAWELVKGDSTAVSSALSGLSAATSPRDKMVLKLDGTALQNTVADTYALAITVTNSLGQSSSAVTQFIVAEAGASPSITVFAPGSDASGSVSVQPSRGLKLYSKLQIDSVCKGVATKVNYRWTCSASDGSACTLPTDAAAFNQLLLSPSDLAVFKLDMDYTFTLAAGFTGSATPTTARAVVRFTRSPLRAMLSGPNGDVPKTKNFTLDASSSSDPDNPAASLRYDFTCAPQPCFTDLAYTGVRPTQSSWNIVASKFAGVSKPYTLTVTVSATGAGDARQASASVTVTPQLGNPPTGTVSRFCGYDATSAPLQCPARHSPSQDLVVTLTPDPDFSAATVQWAMGDQQLQESADVKGVTRYTLTVRPSALPTAGTVKLRAIMSLPGAGSGAASIDVRLNTPPNCPQPPCFFTDINSTVFPAYTFVGTASGWQDADGDVITYEFGQVTGATYQASQPAGPSSTYTFRGFTPGNYSLYACALDTSAGRTCATAPIQVLPPGVLVAAQKSALVENSIGKIDVSQLAISGDVSAVTDAMQEVASLAKFSTSPSLANKTNDLLTTLPAVMNSKDPAAMASSLNAADKVSDAGSAALSGKAGNALLDVVDAFVKANTAGAGASDDQVKTASKVLGKGVAAAAKSTSTAPKGHRRALLATDTTTSTAYARLASGMTGLVALMSASTPIGAGKTIGASDICMGVTRDNGAGGALDSKQLTLDCSGATAAAGASGSKRRVLLTAAPGTASVTMGAGFSTACSADSTCRSGSTVVSQTYVADPATTLDQVAIWPDSSLVSNAKNGTQLSAISGVLNFGLGSRATGPICSTGNCTATLSVPVTGYDPTLNTTCLRLDPGTTGGLAATSVGIAVVPDSTSSSSTSTVKCTTSQLGQVVVVQYRATAAAVTAVTNNTTTSANVTTTSNSTASTNSSAGSPEQVAAPAYAGVDNSTLSASDVGEPVDFSFRFANFDYNSMFKTPGGDINNTALEGFKESVRESFLAGVAQQSKMTVKTQDNKLQLSRVTIKDVRPGSVVTDLEFKPPASATAADISSLKTTVTNTASAFFSAPAFTARYGTPSVTGQVLDTKHGQGPSYALPVGLGVGLGAGVMLLIVAITVYAARRRRASQLAVVEPGGNAGGAAQGARGMHGHRGGDSMSHVA